MRLCPIARRGIDRPRPIIVAAFTILEVLLSLALIALIAGVLIGGSVQVLRDKPISVDDVFWKAVQDARKSALMHEDEVQLRFVKDPEKGMGFVLREGADEKSYPVPAAALANDLQVDFLTTQKGGGNLILIAGVAIETNPVPFVTFYPDGTCTSFRLQIVRSGATHQLAIDPWTCAPVLTTKENGS